jgi:hypothetical protein
VNTVNEAFVSHVEWCCRDIETTADFFQALFGWQFKTFGNNYLLCNPERGPAIGLLRCEPAAQPLCQVFITVDSIDTQLQRASMLGGHTHVEKTLIPDYGWYAQIKEPQGNIVGLFEKIEARG